MNKPKTRFEYNIRASDMVVVEPGEYKGKRFIDIRTHFTPDGGAAYKPTSKGVRVPIEEFPQFVADMNELLAAMT